MARLPNLKLYEKEVDELLGAFLEYWGIKASIPD